MRPAERGGMPVEIGICTDAAGLEKSLVTKFDFVELHSSSVMEMVPKKFDQFLELTRTFPYQMKAGIIRIPPFIKLVKSREEYEFALLYVKKCMERMKRLGAETVTLGSGDAREADLEDPKERGILSSFFREIDGLCSQYDLKMGIEGISRNLCSAFNTASGVEEFVVENRLTNVGVTVDLFHMNDNKEDFKSLYNMKKLFHVHFCNPYTKEFPQIEDGICYGKILEAISCSMEHPRISVEVNHVNGVEEGLRSLAYLQGLTR